MEERVGRQGKGAQNVRNEPNNLPQNSWVLIMTCLGEVRFSKLNILENHPYLTTFSGRGTLPNETGVIFQNIEFEKRTSSKQVMIRTQEV